MNAKTNNTIKCAQHLQTFRQANKMLLCCNLAYNFFSCPVILPLHILACAFKVPCLSVWLQQRRFIGSTSLVLPWGQKQEGCTICSFPRTRDIISHAGLLHRSLHQPCAPHWHVIVRFLRQNCARSSKRIRSEHTGPVSLGMESFLKKHTSALFRTFKATVPGWTSFIIKLTDFLKQSLKCCVSCADFYSKSWSVLTSLSLYLYFFQSMR